MQKILANVLRTLREKDDRNLARTGIRRYFVVGDSFETSNFLGSWARRGETRELRSFDFATMYTNIPLDDLVEKVNTTIDEAFEEKTQIDGKYTPMME